MNKSDKFGFVASILWNKRQKCLLSLSMINCIWISKVILMVGKQFNLTKGSLVIWVRNGLIWAKRKPIGISKSICFEKGFLHIFKLYIICMGFSCCLLETKIYEVISKILTGALLSLCPLLVPSVVKGVWFKKCMTSYASLCNYLIILQKFVLVTFLGWCNLCT